MARSNSFDTYIRVSKVAGRQARDDGTGYQSPEEQRQLIAATAARFGVELSGVEAVEEDVSGKLRAEERGLGDLLLRVEGGQAAGIVVAKLDRLHRPKARDEAELWDRLEAAGGRILTGDGVDTTAPGGELLYRVMGAIAREQWKQRRDGWARAVERMIDAGHHHSGSIPLGYQRDKDGRLQPDPATAHIVVEAFERRARGESWVKLARWLGGQGHPRTESGVKAMVHNPVYTGQARYGDLVKEGAHEAIVARGLWKRANRPGRKSSRDGRLQNRYLLQGLALCGSCGRAMYLSGGKRHGKDYEHYVCRRLECDAHAYARAAQLDAFVLNSVEEQLTGVDYDGYRVDAGDSSRWEAATFVPRPGGDDTEVADAEVALEEARADLAGFRRDTRARRTLGADMWNETLSDYVTAVNAAQTGLEAARKASSGSLELVGRLWLSEWGHAERKEWLERVVREVVVHKGRERLSERVEVELR
jgi:DNA invertase Pin-like site-specific DNA recombinase